MSNELRFFFPSHPHGFLSNFSANGFELDGHYWPTVLLATGTAALIEDSQNDYYWGIGAGDIGRNRLGELLMELREELRDQSV